MRKVKLGSQVLQAQAMEAKGDFVSFEGQAFYRIQKVNAMPPFFMTLVSPYDHWLFVASNVELFFYAMKTKIIASVLLICYIDNLGPKLAQYLAQMGPIGPNLQF